MHTFEVYDSQFRTLRLSTTKSKLASYGCYQLHATKHEIKRRLYPCAGDRQAKQSMGVVLRFQLLWTFRW